MFVVGGDNAVWMWTNSGSAWGGWTSLGSYFATSPAVASLASGHLRVFGGGADGGLWSNEFSGGRWSGWHGLGGRLASAPAATYYPAYGQIEVSVMGTDGLIWTMGLGSGARSGAWINRNCAAWSTLAVQSVSAAPFPGSRVFLDATRAMREYLPVNPPTTYDVRGGGFAANPAVQFTGFGNMPTMVAGIGGDGAMWVQDSRLGPGFVSLGGRFL